MASINSSLKNIVTKETAKQSFVFDRFDTETFRLFGDYVESEEFSPPNSLNKFKFHLLLSKHYDSKPSCFGLTYSGPTKEATIYYRFSVLDADKHEQHIREHRWNYSQYGPKSNSTHFISRNQLKKLLVDGNFTIRCEVDIYEEYSQAESSLGKLSQNYEALLENGILTDFIVQIGDKQFRVHKTVLAARSAVFAAMFGHEQSKEVKEGRMVVEDVEVEVFEMLIRYIYTGKVDELDLYAAELFDVADKYQLDHLKSLSEQSLVSSLTVESVCGVLLLSDMHNSEQLKSNCTEYIVKHAQAVMKTEGWKLLGKTTRADLVSELFEKLAINDDRY